MDREIVDIHSHILHGFDDGAKSPAESMVMARIAADAGTSMMLATPHVAMPHEFEQTREIEGAVRSLMQTLEAEGIPVRLLPGAEVYPSMNVLPALDSGLPLTIGDGGRYMLIDMPLTALPLGLGHLLFDLQTRGITPILAHPERVVPVQQNPQEIEEFLQRGVLIQVNASSVTGENGEEAMLTAEALFRHRWVHFVASDAHSTGRRKPGLQKALEDLVELIGEDQAWELVSANGQRLVRGEEIPSDPAEYKPEPKRSGLLARLFTRRRP